MPNDAKAEPDRTTHRLQDQPTTARPKGTMKSEDSGKVEQRQPQQAQQRDRTGTTLSGPDEASNDDEDPDRT